VTMATYTAIASGIPHTRHSAYVDLPSTIPTHHAANLIRYADCVLAYRHPELELLRLVLDESAEVIHAASDSYRYPFHIVVSTRTEAAPDLLDTLIVEVGQAMIAHCKPADGRRPGVGLARAEGV
jgi:hypothetical protein